MVAVGNPTIARSSDSYQEDAVLLLAQVAAAFALLNRIVLQMGTMVLFKLSSLNGTAKRTAPEHARPGYLCSTMWRQRQRSSCGL